MKAWHVHDGYPLESSTLVFAPTRNRARTLAQRHAAWDYDEYVLLRAVRAPKWDGLSAVELVCDTNEDIPAGGDPFYREGEDGE
jgi:hypothetical protein